MLFKAFCNRQSPAPILGSAVGWLRQTKTLLVVQLTAILLTICSLTVTARSVSQSITFSGKDVELEKIFAIIKQQTGHFIFYQEELLANAKPVTIKATGMPLAEFMSKIMEGQPLTYSIKNTSIIIKSKSTVTDLSLRLNLSPPPITGRITDSVGNPLVGATVSIRSKSKIVTTDETGGFIINAEPGDVIIVSYIGFEGKEVRVSDAESLTISLVQKESRMDEIIVNTGYQKMKPNEVNGSVVVIDNKTLNQQVGTNILQRLNGVTSGLLFNLGKSNGNPQNKTNISIRGLSTINGPLDPLIILDNFIYEGDIANINPNDIESVTILKDAAAASIWGARAGNGVIVLTSKRGRFNQKPKITFNSTVTVMQKPNLFDLSQISSADYIDVEEFLFNNGYFDDQINFSPHNALTPAVEILLKRRNNIISASDSAGGINALKQIDFRDGFHKYFYEQAITQQYALGISGGSEKHSYILSTAYDRDIGALGEMRKKINLRMENTYRPIENLQLSAGIYYTNGQGRTGKPDHSGVTQIGGRYVPYLSYVDEQGNFASVAYQYRDDYTDTAGAGKLLDWKYIPLEDYQHNRTTTKLEEIVGNVGMDYQVKKYLRLGFQYQYQRQRQASENYADIRSFYTRNAINLFTQLDRNTGVVQYIIPPGGIFNVVNTEIHSQNLRGQVNFDKSWNDHQIAIMAGTEIRETVNASNGNVLFGYQEDPLSYSNVDLVNSYPTFITGNLQSLQGQPSLRRIANRFVAAYANFSYIFKQRYMISGSTRRDGSNIFGVNTNDRWKPLWSASIGWDISREPFYQIDWLPLVKLKSSIGYSGNVDLTKSAVPVASYGSAGDITGFPRAVIEAISNPELRWEQAKQWNIGLDFSTKRQILSGSIEFYTKNGSDLYGATPYDYTAWGASNVLTKNVANMKGKGVDVILQSKNTNGVLKWTTNLLFNYNSTKTTAYFDPSFQGIYSILGGGTSITPVVGKPLYAVAAYKWGGLDAEGNPQGFLNGQLSTDYQGLSEEALTKQADNIKYIGAASPTVFGSLINYVSWKQLTFSLNIAYKFGYYFVKPSIRYSSLINAGIGHADYSKRWQQAGDELQTNIPSFIYPADTYRDDFYSLSEINVLNGGHIRLQYINCAYTFNLKRLSSGNKSTSIQAYVNVANLGILWRANNESIDPDYPASVRPPRSFAAGIRADF